MTTWQEIKTAALAAGVDADVWEERMHDRLLTSLVKHTNTEQQWLHDAAFHAQMSRLLAYILGTIFEHDPLSEDMRSKAHLLTQLFHDEIRDVQSG